MTKKEVKLVEELMKTPKKNWTKIGSRGPYQGQCYSLEKDGYCICVSYTTPIAMKTPKGEFVRLWDGYTKTSISHLSTWCVTNKIPFVNGNTWYKLTVGRKYKAENVLKIANEKGN